MLLHNDKDLFREVVLSTSEKMNLVVPIVEKDYYVTMLLQKLAADCPASVFKGGTSLSKCYHIIDRFSEDIDISFSRPLTQGMRKQLKHRTILEMSDILKMPVLDLDNTRSRRDYNCYIFSYAPIEGYVTQGRLIPGVKMEVSLSTISFPTISLPVDSYVYQFLSKENMDIVE